MNGRNRSFSLSQSNTTQQGIFVLKQETTNQQSKSNLFFDSFKTLDNWNVTTKGSSNNAVLNARRGKQLVTTGKVPNDYFCIDLKSHGVTIDKEPVFKIKFKLNEITSTKVTFGLKGDNSNYIQFIYEAEGESEKWQVETKSKGKNTVNETVMDCTKDPHIFEIECKSDKIIFKMDGKYQITHNTDLTPNSMKMFYKHETLTQEPRVSTLYFMELSYN